MSLFSCPTCLRRAIQTLVHDHPASSTLLQAEPLPRHGRSKGSVSANHTTKRNHATYDSLVKGHHRRVLRHALNKNTIPNPNNRRKGAGSLTRSEIKDALARENNRARLSGVETNNAALSSSDQKQLVRLRKDVEQYYPDPLQLGNAVVAKLRVPDFAGALALVRASEGIVDKNIVSWNHCVDWCMSQGETDRAWKLYNELKKRGHKPDAYTYTIMLRGLSRNAHVGQSAERAVGIYNSMFAPNSAVVPNTIHTNAALNVCARTMDMESLWAIAGKLPERGPGAPDRMTFTVILNAIREDAVARVAALWKNSGSKNHQMFDETTGEKLEWADLEARQKVIFDDALKDGRKLWADVSHRWRRADLVVDEKLVCTMGRLILGCGLPKDFGEVFDLVDSMMNIRLGERGYKKGAAVDTEEHKKVADVEAGTEVSTTLVEADESPLPLGQSQVYATPGNETLSLILGAATGSKQFRLGKSYWHYLTTQGGPYKINPDAANIIAYLRLLRINRASQDSLDLLSRDWPAPVAESLYRRATFVIAMSTCIRDKNNPNVFETADKLLALMHDKLEEVKMGVYNKIEDTEHNPNLSYKERRAASKARAAEIDDVTFGEDEATSELQRTKSGVESSIVDPKALRMYLDLAILKTPGWNEGLKDRDDGNEKFERDRKKNVTLRAIRRVDADLVNIRRLARMKLTEAETAARTDSSAAMKNPYFIHSSQPKPTNRSEPRIAERLDDMVELLKTMTRVYDKVLYINERFEDKGLPQLDKNLIQDCRDDKRRISALLFRTNSEVETLKRGDLKFAKWRNISATSSTDPSNEDLDEDDEDESPTTNPARETPHLAKQIQAIYADTDRDLGRVQHYSRRQRFERKQAVDRRMSRRLGVGADPGVLDDDLSVKKKEEVEGRMRERAFGIGRSIGGERGVGSRGVGDNVNERYSESANGDGKTSFRPLGGSRERAAATS